MSIEQLQAGDGQSETPIEAGTGSAPDTGDNQEQNNEGAASNGAEGGNGNDPSGFTKRIHKKHHELMEERRARLAVEAELQKLRTQQPQEQRPEIPPVPDPYDEDFDDKMKQRDKAIVDAQAFDVRQSQQQAQQQEAQQRAAQEQQQKFANDAQEYAKRATALNVSKEKLQAAAQTVAAYGIGMELTQHIIQDEQGPLITTYLAENPDELERIVTLDPMGAAVHIATAIKPKLVAGNSMDSDPPPPADTLSGGGAPPQERGPKGAKFE